MLWAFTQSYASQLGKKMFSVKDDAFKKRLRDAYCRAGLK
jgi:hypothetical protein